MSVQTLDYSLLNFKVPGLARYTPPFGTKKPDGSGLTTTEITRNEMMPFMKQRSISGVPAVSGNDPPMGVITVNSIATPIEFDANFAVAAGIQLQLADPSYEGQMVRVVASFAAGNAATIILGVAGTPTIVLLSAGKNIFLVAINGKWVVSGAADIEDLFIGASAALDLGGLAYRENMKTNTQRNQSGSVMLYNRGIISGCTASKAVNGRKVLLSTGIVFAKSLELPMAGDQAGVSVPVNAGDAAKVYYAYLVIGANNAFTFAITPAGAIVPAAGIPIVRITVPAGDSTADLSGTTLTDVRRLEFYWPNHVNTMVYAPVALPFDMVGVDYQVYIEASSWTGGKPNIYTAEKATNGFKIYIDGASDEVNIRWTATKPKL
jgi:hypothetical protein